MRYTRILSGIRPTGHIHLGNYLGAIAQWVNMASQTDDMFFCVVDQHALTTVEDAHNLAENTRTIAAAYIACGINPAQSAIFAQSHVPYHTELAWYLNCVAPLGWLNRMTQFKDKAGKHKEHANLGLYAYPVLMAADILLYKASQVPVGEDQKQHVELARDLAGAFNHFVKQEVFKLPEPVIQKETARIMSLRDGTKKMSKSDISDYSRINLLDSDDDIALKIRKAKTDSDALPGAVEGLAGRPEAENLLSIYAALTRQSLESACHVFEGKSFSLLKENLTAALIEHLSPIRQKITELTRDKHYVDSLLAQGAQKAIAHGQLTMREVRSALGLL